MGSKTGPIRSQIGPLRSNLGKHQQAAKDLLDKDTDIEPNDFVDLINDINFACEKLDASTTRLRTKHDEWTRMVVDLATEAEQTLYDEKCNDIMELLLDSDDLLMQLGHHVSRLRRLLQSKIKSADDANQAAATPVFSLQALVARTQSQQQRATPLQIQTQPVPNPPVSNPQPPPAAPVRPHSTAFKAPKINLPTFSGNYMEFKQFWGIFEANIDSHPNLTNIEKFTYLLGQLRGDARLSLADLLISNDNYDVAIGLLKSRYDRADDRLITMLYSAFSRIPTSSDKLADKQRTLDECERIFRQLETTGEDVNANRSLVIGLLSKFPPGMVRDLQRYYGVGANSTLKEVREGLQRSIIADETTSGVLDDLQSLKVSSGRDNQNHHQGRENQNLQGRNQNSQRGSQFRGDVSDNYTTFYPQSYQYHYQDPTNHTPPRDSTLATTARSFDGPSRPPQNTSPQSPCYFCEGNHFNGDCTAYPSAQVRKYRLAQVNRCTYCMVLKRNHVNGRCPTVPIKCVFCKTKGDHRSALCFLQYPNGLNAEDASAPVFSTGNNSNTDPTTIVGFTSGPPTTPTTQSAAAPANGGMVALNHADVKSALFQTAQTTAVNSKTGQQCIIRLALDTLSSRSYITESAANKLGLTTNQSEKLLVSVFGCNKTLEVPTTRVEFDLTFQNNQKYRVEANTTRVICSAGANLNNWSEQERNALSIFEKSLADDPYDKDRTIDILIGAALVWDVIQGPRVPTLAPNLFLIPSKFGLMLSGETERESDTARPAMLCITDSPRRFHSELGLVACESKHEPSYPDIDQLRNIGKTGISDDPIEISDDKTIKNFEQTVKSVAEQPLTDTAIQQFECELQPRFFGQTLAVPVATPNLPLLAMDPENFVSLRKLVRVYAICLKFLKRRIWSKISSATQDAKPALRRLFQGISDDSDISCTDYDTAKHQWVKSVQQDHYTDILETLSAADPQQPKSKRPHRIDELGLRLDENGLMRAAGRVENADLLNEAKCPSLLPKTDRFTTLVIEDVHASSSMHSDISHTLSLVRLKYWIPHGRALVRRIVRGCFVCRRYKAAPFKLPPKPPWPQERVARSAPFQATGDYCSPVHSDHILSNGFKLRRALTPLIPLEVEQPAPEVDPEQSSSIEEDDTPESDQPLPPSGEEDAENNAPVQHIDEDDNDTDADDDFFYGNSPDGVRRAADALQRFDDLNDGVSNRQ